MLIINLLPKFKKTCIIVGITYAILPLSLFYKGLITSMSEFKVPETVLLSPHYFDAILWVYIHMMVLGVLIFIIGMAVKDTNAQKWISLVLLIISCFYAYLDFRTADWAFGNALYKGDSSIAPAIIGSITCLLFLQLTMRFFSNNIEKY
jgi:hypothetical protein